METCRFCTRVDKLRKSHILPNFVFKPTFDEDHAAITWNPETARRGKRHSGYWEWLLCDACEDLFGAWESYFADIWFENRRRPDVLSQDTVTITGLDYTRLRLFFLSILWRAAASTRPQFEDIRLGRHEQKIHSMLLEGDPGPESRYPIAALALRDQETGGFKDELMALPSAGKFQGHHIYRTLFGGVWWHFIISSHRHDRPVPPTLLEDGSLTMAVQNWTENPAILDVARQVREWDARRSRA